MRTSPEASYLPGRGISNAPLWPLLLVGLLTLVLFCVTTWAFAMSARSAAQHQALEDRILRLEQDVQMLGIDVRNNKVHREAMEKLERGYLQKDRSRPEEED